MNIVFYSNFLNHHQVALADELFRLTDGNFLFVETERMPGKFTSNGYPSYDKPYLIKAWQSPAERALAMEKCLSTDVLLMGGEHNYPLAGERLRHGRLTFEVAERWLKRGLANLCSPRLIKSQLWYHLCFHNKPYYRLNASAFAANDMALMRSFKGRMYKWGYFPEVPEIDVESIIAARRSAPRKRLMWVARFIAWKHPELPPLLVKALTDKGYDVELDMYGSGELHEKTADIIRRHNLGDRVRLKGSIPNAQISEEMQNHHLLLFTSDRNEGWGAVVNEAMGNGCPVIASDKIGSVPYLIRDGYSGLVFRQCDLHSLVAKAMQALDNEEATEQMTRRAYETISTIWSAPRAARNLISLSQALMEGREPSITEGPGSAAYPI